MKVCSFECVTKIVHIAFLLSLSCSFVVSCVTLHCSVIIFASNGNVTLDANIRRRKARAIKKTLPKIFFTTAPWKYRLDIVLQRWKELFMSQSEGENPTELLLSRVRVGMET